jgi:DNA polymerase-3 subunit gamma/tau
MTLLRLLAFRAGGSASGERAEAPRAATKSAAPKASPKAAAESVAREPRVGIAEPAPAPAGDWEQRIEQLGLEGLVKQLARNCACVEASADAIRLALDPKMKHLLSEPRRVAMEQALAKQSGRPVKLTIEAAAQPLEDTPSQRELKAAAARVADAGASIERDPFIQLLKKETGATVRSIEPLNKG